MGKLRTRFRKNIVVGDEKTQVTMSGMDVKYKDIFCQAYFFQTAGGYLE